MGNALTLGVAFYKRLPIRDLGGVHSGTGFHHTWSDWMKFLPCSFKFGCGQVTTFAQYGRLEAGVTTKDGVPMQDTLLVTLLMDFVTTAFKTALITVPVKTRHSTEDVVTGFGYLLLVSTVNILGLLPSTFNVNVVGSLDCAITDEGVIHEIAVKVNAVDEDVKMRDARLRIKVKTDEYLCPVQIELSFSFLLAFLGLDILLELIEEL